MSNFELEKIATIFLKISGQNMMYAYHVTLKKFLPSILEKGLLPAFHPHTNEPIIFVERDREEAEIYAEEDTVILRFLVDGFGCTEDGEDVLYDVISPAEIEVSEHYSKKWISLDKYVNEYCNQNK